MNYRNAGKCKQCHTETWNLCPSATRQSKLSFVAVDCSNDVASRRLQYSLHNSLLITCQQILRLPTTVRGKAKANYLHSNDSISITEQKKVHRALCGGRGRPVWRSQRIQNVATVVPQLVSLRQVFLKKSKCQVSLSKLINILTISCLTSSAVYRHSCWTCSAECRHFSWTWPAECRYFCWTGLQYGNTYVELGL